MKCGARKYVGCFASIPHVCGLEKGHKEKHRCCRQTEGTMVKSYKKPIPCNRRWGKIRLCKE